MLPFNEKTHEDFQWLKQEIESAGGEATVLRADSVEGVTDEIIASFRRDRDEEYSRVTAGLDGSTGAIREVKHEAKLSVARVSGYEAELDKLHAELERIIATDFFGARGRAAAVAAYGRCQKALRSSRSRGAEGAKIVPSGGALDLAQYQGRRWVTRRNLHIDRLASA